MNATEKYDDVKRMMERRKILRRHALDRREASKEQAMYIGTRIGIDRRRMRRRNTDRKHGNA